MGAGGSSSYVRHSVKTKSAVNAITRNVFNCSNNKNLEQSIRINCGRTVLDGVTQRMNISSKSACQSDSQTTADIKQQVANELKAEASSQNVALLGALGTSRSEVDQNIVNDVEQNITVEKLNDMANDINAKQELVVNGCGGVVIRNTTQDIGAQIAFDAAEKVLTELKSVQAIENAATGKATSKNTNPISDIIDSVFGGMNTMSAIFAVVFIVLGGIMLWKYNPFVLLAGGSAEEAASGEYDSGSGGSGDSAQADEPGAEGDA